MSLQGWHELKCPKCEGTKFFQVSAMIWQQGMGTSTRPLGHACHACGEIVDQAKMIAHARKVDAEQKIKDLETQLG